MRFAVHRNIFRVFEKWKTYCEDLLEWGDRLDTNLKMLGSLYTSFAALTFVKVRPITTLRAQE